MARLSFALAFVSALLALGGTNASPISHLEERASGLSCSSTVFARGSLYLGDINYGTDQYLVGQTYSSGGQLQLTRDTNNAKSLEVIVRQCNSTYLDFDYSEIYRPGGSAAKIFLASDESKCVQRHATLPSSNSFAKTHLTIEDCSSIDDSRQAKEFWDLYMPYQNLHPIVKEYGRINDVPIVLSSSTPAALEATRQPDSGVTAYSLVVKSA